MSQAELTMAGHLHPLIIRLVLETVWMAGDSTSFDVPLGAWITAIRYDTPSSVPETHQARR